MVVLFDGGIMVIQVVCQLCLGLCVMIVIYSFNVVIEVVVYFQFEILMFGGWLFWYLMVNVGVVVIDVVLWFWVDFYFMGVIGVYFEMGLIIGDVEEVVVKSVLY